MNNTVIWKCQACGAKVPIEYATNKQKVVCPKCGATHRITGLHVNGTPFVRIIGTPPARGKYYRPKI